MRKHIRDVRYPGGGPDTPAEYVESMKGGRRHVAVRDRCPHPAVYKVKCSKNSEVRFADTYWCVACDATLTEDQVRPAFDRDFGHFWTGK